MYIVQYVLWVSRSSTVTVCSLEQRYLLAPADVKDAYVVHVLREYLAAEEHKRSSVLLFCSTRKYAQLLAMVLRRFGLESASLHAALKQRERLRVLQRFKSLQTRILIATDLASRFVYLYKYFSLQYIPVFLFVCIKY